MSRLRAVPSRLRAAETQRVPEPKRSSARGRGYTAKWDKASKAFLRANPYCRGCLALGRAEPARLTDHVIPHRGDTHLFWQRELWQASCRWHHDVVKERLEHLFDAGQVTAEDLWLDSEVAKDLARRLLSDATAWGGGVKT